MNASEQTALAGTLTTGAGRSLPRLPGTTGANGASDAATIAFHRLGPDAEAASGLRAGVVPAALVAAQGEADVAAFPLYLADDASEPARPLAELVAEAAGALSDNSAVRRYAQRFVELVAGAVGPAGAADANKTLADAWATFVGDFEVSEEAAAEIRADADTVAAELPRDGLLLAPRSATTLHLYFHALARARRAAMATIGERARTLSTRLGELLEVDALHDRDQTNADTIEASLAGGGALIDSAALARTLPAHRGSVRMSAEARRRIERARTAIDAFLAEGENASAPIVLATASLPAGAVPANARVAVAENAFDAAAKAFDAAAAGRVALIAALRVAELETAHEWDDALHAGAIASLTWDACAPEELLALPPVVVVHVAGANEAQRPDEVLSRFSRVIRTERPIHALIVDEAGGLGSGLAAGRLTGRHRAEALSTVMQREAFVVQSTLANPAHVVASLDRLANAPRTGVALVVAPAAGTGGPDGALLAAMLEGRGTPCFVYDPSRGATWADRFELDGNPQSEAVWPTYELACTADDDESTLELATTFADAASLAPALGSHFLLLDADGWADDQLPLDAYLEADAPKGTLPFVWFIDDRGELTRAIVSRELAWAARDRAHLWRFIQELGGIGNEHARRAVEAARADLDAEHESALAAQAARHAEEIDAVRQQAATEAMERLVAVLLDLNAGGALPAGFAMPAAAPVAEGAPSPVEEAPVEAAPEPAEEEDEAVSFDDPYIDAVLCTTCNECTNLNSLMFVYNSDKQAEIADATKGTFAELVKAAELCPARCIHPGKPRADDSTANDDLIARAAPFN